MTTVPALTPAFGGTVSDYVVRCVPGQPVTVQVSAPGRTQVSVDGRAFAFGVQTVPVTMSAGQSFSLVYRIGVTDYRTFVRCLPADFPTWTIEGAGSGAASWYAFSLTQFTASPPYAIITDSRGTPVWWYRETDGSPTDVKVLGSDRVAWAGNAAGSYVLRRLDGTVAARLGTGLDPHDLQVTPQGTYLGIRYVSRGCPADPTACVDLSPWGGPSSTDVYDGEVVELAADGRVLWTWSTRDHFTLADSARWLLNGGAYLFGVWDLVHLNSVEPDGDGVIVSARHLDAVFRVDKATGEVTWKLGGTSSPASLRVVGDTSDPLFGGQHDARIAGNRLTLYDNGSMTPRKPRAVSYALDLQARTATLTASLTDTSAGASLCCGNARQLSNGNWLVSWASNSLLTETTPAGSPIWSLRPDGGAFAYRVVGVPPGQVSAASLRAGMDAQFPRHAGSPAG